MNFPVLELVGAGHLVEVDVGWVLKVLDERLLAISVPHYHLHFRVRWYSDDIGFDVVGAGQLPLDRANIRYNTRV